MGVVVQDDFRIYSIALDDKSLREVQVEWGERASDPRSFFTLLENERPNAAIAHSGWISNVVLSLLDASMSLLIGLEVSHDDATSLIGRALFTRFLGDRNLLPESKLKSGGVAHLFDTPKMAKQTSNGSTKSSMATCCPCPQTSLDCCLMRATENWEIS